MNLTAATKLAAALPLALALSAAAQPVEFGPPYSIAGGFENPFGVAVDPAQGHLLVTDTRNRQIQWATLSSLAASPAFRSFGYVADTTSPSALFDPQGMAVDRAGHVYVVDAKRNQVNLYTWSPGSGTYELDSTFASATRNTVAGTAIESPRAVATAPDGKVYMLDSGRKRVLRADGPADTTWEVFISDATLGNAYGIGVGPDGRVYVADTDHHRILRYESNGSSTAFGRFGGGAGEFSYPRDIAIGTDGRLYVADTGNHRIAVLDDSGRYLYAMGRAPAVGFVQKVAVGAGPKLFAADSDRNIVIAYLGRGTAAPYDGWLRDFVGDTGTEPSSSAFTPSSPDVLVRSLADVDAAAANVSGLETVSFQNPRFGTDNQVYVAVRNRGRQELRDAVALLYWADPAGGLAFPADWRTTGFFAGPGSASASDRLEVPPLAPGASAVLGPLRFLPPSPDSSQFNNGAFLLGVRILNSFDYAPAGTGLAAVRASNNVAIRPIKVTRGPFAIGDQNTLVVRADFPDVAGSASEAFVQERISDADAWINSVSYGKTRLRPLFVGPITLDQPKSYYDDPTSSHLIELTTEVLNKVLAANPGVLDGPTPDPSDDIGRIVVVLNDPALAKDWASTGSWPYLVGGTTRYLSTSIHGASDTAAQFAHGISHQLGLKDLYVHDNVNADPGLIDAVSRWDNMARPFEGAHPVVWSKQLATWVTSANGRILYIRRPPRGTPPRVGEPAIPMNYQSTLASGGYAAIAIGLSEGVTTLEEESQFYWIEARKGGLGGDNVPSQGVLVYYANNLVPQGEVPVVVRDAIPGGPRDPLDVGGTMQPSGTGISILVESGRGAGAIDGYMVKVDYSPPATGYDVSIRVGDPPWTSPDIWVDNARDGGGFGAYDATNYLSSGPGTEQPIAKEVNRIYARVHNAGPATAHDVEVAFEMSEPYHTVGGEGDFSPRAIRIIPTIPAGEYRDVYFDWTPTGTDDPHTCVRVALRRLNDDTNPANNAAQQNLSVQESRTNSPYTEVKLDFSITNDTPQPRLVYFRADDMPRAWSHHFAADKTLLAPGQKYIGSLTVKPNDEAPICRSTDIHVTGWAPRGDTLVRLGGTTLSVALRKTAEIDVATTAMPCYGGGDDSGLFGRRFCERIVARGCTRPPQPNQAISVRYTDATGKPVWREVHTDSAGCFEDSYVANSGGPWVVTAYYPGDGCLSSATNTSNIKLPSSNESGDERRREWGIFIEYLHLQQKIGIRSPWMLGARYSVQLNASWAVESELSVGASKNVLGSAGRILQLTGHSVYQTQPFGARGWRAYAIGGIGLIAFDGFGINARSTTADLGVGLKVPLSARVNLRGDVRQVIGSSVFGAGTSRNLELTLGLSVRF